MAYKKFYLAILFRLIIIILLSMTLTFFFFEKQAYFICLVVSILLVGAVINIIKYFNNINQWIALFLLGIENEDTTLKAPSQTGNKVVDDVYRGIERLNDIFKQAKLEINMQEQYYLSVINQSATGLFSINEDGRVINVNPAAVKLTDLHDYHHINSLTSIDSVLPDFIMHPGQKLNQQSAIFENKYGQKLLFKLSKIKTTKETIRLVAVSDITKELDNGEVDAWIKLARTLSHEIMNNIAPITTLAQVISKYYTKNNKLIGVKDVEPETIANTVKGLEVIEERSLGLMNFVDNYRKFTKLPTPDFKEVNLSSLFDNILITAGTFSKFDTVKLRKNIPENLLVITDEKLLSQVLINLLKNACEALVFGNVSKPELTIKVLQTSNTTKIDIVDNGPAIPREIRELIFIPFFTTKDEGSGIGLSLSKQIMLKMNGDILLNSAKDNLTIFTVILN